jgi:hypothetical protein
VEKQMPFGHDRKKGKRKDKSKDKSKSKANGNIRF